MSIVSAQLISMARQSIIHFLVYSLLSPPHQQTPIKGSGMYLVPEPEGNRLFVRSGCIWEDIIKTDVKEVEGWDTINLV